MFRVLILSVVILFFSAGISHSCTTAIVSGKYTVDGRPLLFKHRDTGFRQNKLMYFYDGKYDYIGTVNSVDPEGKEIWAGFNSAGFGIMNAEAYNLNIGDTITLKDREGALMKEALQQCANLADFENFLDNYAQPRGVRANFGVIDAEGGAAYYETGHQSWIKHDANDPAQAPFGYLIRTNFAFSGVKDRGYGYIRYQNAENLLYQAAAENNLNKTFILQEVSRSLKHSLIGIDLKDSDTVTGYTCLGDYIPRYSSASTTVLQGVRADEDPALTTMWTVLGFQLCTPAIPVWLNDKGFLPEVTQADESGNAPLCDMALQLKRQCFPVLRGSGDSYLYLPAVYNKSGTGILQKVLVIENLILDKAESLQRDMYQNGNDLRKIEELYDWVDQTIRKNYTEILGI